MKLIHKKFKCLENPAKRELFLAALAALCLPDLPKVVQRSQGIRS